MDDVSHMLAGLSLNDLMVIKHVGDIKDLGEILRSIFPIITRETTPIALVRRAYGVWLILPRGDNMILNAAPLL